MNPSRPSIIYPLATSSWDQEELAAIQGTIARDYYTMGPSVAKFEAEFARWAGSRYCVMVNSGSSANLLMVGALRFRKESPLMPGDEILVPAVSWATSYYPFTQYGLKLRFVDIDLDTLNYDLERLGDALTPRTRAVLAVNLLGNPNDFDRLRSLLSGRNILLLEDNCESMGALYQGRQAGTFGVMGTFSTFFSHHMSTMEGGLILTDDRELYELLLCLRAHGWTRQLPDENLVSGRKSEDPFEELFKFVLPGYNVRPLEMEAAIGSEQLRKLPGFVDQRRKNAGLFQALFRDHEHFRIQQEIGASSWFGFSLILRESSPLARRDVVSRLQANGIECRPIVGGNFTKNPVMRWLDHTIHRDLRNADQLDQRGLFVGNQEIPLDTQITHLAEVLSQPE
jgi:CDP-4-dehydro-6-deoxyglucose reductase, E1